MYIPSFKILVTAIAVVAVIASVGCGSSPDDSPDAQQAGATSPSSARATGSPEQQVTAAMVRLQDAFYAGDARTVCDGIARPIVKQIAAAGVKQDRNATCESVVKTYAVRTTPAEAQKNKATILKVTVDGERATVRARQAKRKPYSVPFIKESGRWKMNTGLGLT